MTDKPTPDRSDEWINRLKKKVGASSPPPGADQPWCSRFSADFRNPGSVALRDILVFTAKLPISTVEIDINGQAIFELPAAMAAPLGLGNEPTSISITSPDFQNPAVKQTHGLAIWLKHSLFESGQENHAREFNNLIRPAILSFCKTLSANYQIPIYPAFIPINGKDRAAGSVLVIMSDEKGQQALLGKLRIDLMRELTDLGKALPDLSGKPPSAQR